MTDGVRSRREIPVSLLGQDIGQRWTRRRWFDRIPDQPLLHLVRDAQPDVLADQIDRYLGSAVPHVVVDVSDRLPGSERARSVAIRSLLDTVVRGLGEHDSWRRVGRLRFQRYALASWLLRQNQEPTEINQSPNKQARRLLRDYLRGRLSSKQDEPAGQREQDTAAARLDVTAARVEPMGLPWYLKIPAIVSAVLLPPVFFGLWIRFGAPRWFMRQRYLAPRESADFASFAQRLLTTPSLRESAEEVRKLLTHAFLEDLADSYTRRPWRWQWVRKDSYPVLLTRGLAPGTVGEALVGLLNDVRNETGAADPLLVIATGSVALSHGSQNEQPATLREWASRLMAARRRRSPTAWYLPVPVASDDTLATGSVDDLPDAVWAWPGRIPVREVRSRMLRLVPAMLVMALVAGSTATYARWHQTHCGRWLPWNGNDLWTAGAECIGVTGSGHLFAEKLREAQQKLAEQNEAAERDHAAHPERPYVTVVYFGMLSSADDSALEGARAELEGVAVAQREALDANVAMRIVLANAGSAMAYAPDVADRVVELARRDPSVIGVVGLGQSREPTYRAMRRLERAGLPMTGTATSSDRIPTVSKLYHQVPPTNRREAQVVAHYARNVLRVPRMHVYYAPNDDYSENLANDTVEELQRSGLTVTREPYEGNPFDSGRDTCGKGPTFISGRSSDLIAFMQGLIGRCPANPPALLAGDDVTKFVLEKGMETLPGLTLDYVAFASTASCGTGGAREFSGAYQKVFHRSCHLVPDGRAFLSHDSINIMRHAVHNLRRDDSAIPLTPAAIWRGISEIHGENAVHGASGLIDYGKIGDQIPVNKAISVLRVVGGPPRGPERMLQCGQLYEGDAAGDPACPADPED